jgi:hypothetical protein
LSIGAGENRSKQANVDAPITLSAIEEVPEDNQVVMEDNADDNDDPLRTLEPAVVETAVVTT